MANPFQLLRCVIFAPATSLSVLCRVQWSYRSSVKCTTNCTSAPLTIKSFSDEWKDIVISTSALIMAAYCRGCITSASELIITCFSFLNAFFKPSHRWLTDVLLLFYYHRSPSPPPSECIFLSSTHTLFLLGMPTELLVAKPKKMYLLQTVQFLLYRSVC